MQERSNSDIVTFKRRNMKLNKANIKPGLQRIYIRVGDIKGYTLSSHCIYARNSKAAIEVLNRVKALMAELDGMVVE